ncbi:hypothetical protein [Pseudomonas sp. Marseille-Q5299]|uniref:immunity protein Imm33 domain-containing protein n=1 Tax=Pseudomonas sp. Marseille-Q5299 TaxID=2942201 RepID=UPI0020738775|nr:hypothetical protein [Pseudomonas sp. Marseille-Q5299]
MKYTIVESNSGRTISTSGLLQVANFELCVTFDDLSLRPLADEFLNFVYEIVASGQCITSGGTLSYGSWITQVQLADNNILSFWEQKPNSTEYEPGITRTLKLWHAQHEVCRKLAATYTPPRFEQLVVVSAGVLEGEATEGVRYPSPDHMSGWWLSTDRYDGNLESLQTLHLQHVVNKRPDLVKYLALPFGYRFYGPTDQYWQDEKIECEDHLDN